MTVFKKVLAWCGCISASVLLFCCANVTSRPATDEAAAAQTAGAGGTFAFAGFTWQVVSGTASVHNGTLFVSAPEEGIAVQLTGESLQQLADVLDSEQFYVEAVVRPTGKGSGSNKNFGVASHIGKTADGKDNFYYAGVNFNGRTQLGTGLRPKGLQFGSLVSDTSVFSADGWQQFYKIRYEYDKGSIAGYINNIQFIKSGQTSYTIPSGETVADGTVGIYTNGDSFEMTSFRAGKLTEGYAGLLLSGNSTDFITLASGSEKYIFLNSIEYEVRAGSDPVSFTVTAFDDSKAPTGFSVESSDKKVVSAVKTDGGFTLNFESTGNAVITVQNDAAPAEIKTVYVTVLEPLAETDTDYGVYTGFYPQPGATGVFEDSALSITFDGEPELNEGSVYIYKNDGTLVDEIKIGAEQNTVSDGTNSYNFTLKNFMVQKSGNTVHIIPHSGVLEPLTEYYVAIGDGSITGTVNGKKFTGFTQAARRWYFTTREAHTPADSASITVSLTDSTADYRTVQAALAHAVEGSVITVDPGIYREIVYYKKGFGVTITGNTETPYGADVVIQGINCNAYNGSSHTRAAFYWSGSDLTLKNLTIENAYDRNVDGTAQSEALFFANGAGKKLTAYNCSFKGHQDTLQTSGKNWFYRCYIEGDTDFIWGTADVSLFEECRITMLDSTGDEVKASDAIIFETRVGNTAETVVPKGYVLLNCTVDAQHPTSYLARRATNKSTTAYYDQAAVINCTFTGTLNEELWLSQNVKADKNLPEYLEKDAGGNMNVGWKVYGGSGIPEEKIDSYQYAGTVSEDVYSREYSNRDQIMNRVFNKNTGTYESAATKWDLDSGSL